MARSASAPGVRDEEIESLYLEIEHMTRRLEMEKRRKHLLEKEIGTVRNTCKARQSWRSRSGGCSRPLSARGLDGLQRSRGSGTRASSTESVVTETLGMGTELLPPQRCAPKVVAARLERQQKQLDSLEHGNRELRAKIDNLRRERLQLNNVFDQLKTEIRQCTNRLRESVEETEANKSAQNHVQNRAQALKTQREVLRSQFKNEVKKVREQLDQQKKEKRSMEVTLQHSDYLLKKSEPVQVEEERNYSKSFQCRRVLKTTFFNCVHRRRIKENQRNGHVFSQAFATIKSSTGIERIDDIVETFAKIESRNYSLMMYVNHMNREIAALEAVRREREQEQLAEDEQQHKTKQERHVALDDVQRQLQVTAAAAAEGRAACAQYHEIFQQMRPFVSQIITSICDEVEKLDMTVPTKPEDLREETIPHWLAWVETSLGRWRELMPKQDKELPFPCTVEQTVRAMQAKRNPIQMAQPLVKPQELPSAVAMAEEASSPRRRADFAPDDDSEDEDLGDRPLLLKELRSRVELSARRRRLPASKGAGVKMIDRNSTQSSCFSGGDRRTTTLSVCSEVVEPVRDEFTRSLNAIPKLPSHAEVEEETTDETNEDQQREPKPDMMSEEKLGDLANRVGVSVKTVGTLKRDFDEFDKDKSGFIDKGEFRGLLGKLGEDLSLAELDRVFNRLDLDRSGEIEFSEFVEWFYGSGKYS